MAHIKLSEISTQAAMGISKSEARKKLKEISKEIAEQKEMLMAQNDKNLLIVMQGMDSSGKDSAVSAAFGRCTPVGMQTYSFKKPTEEEMAHDFLWRVHKQAPRKGEIAVFLRSHYEDILIQRVHGWIDEERVTQRMEAINAWERLLQFDNNTTVLKFYLHMSFEKQAEELMERIVEKEKHWKHNDGDWEEREHWDAYMNAYEYAINNSTTPWHIIPVDNRWYKNYAIAQKILETLKGMNLSYPELETNREW